MQNKKRIAILSGSLMFGIGLALMVWYFTSPNSNMPDSVAQKMGYKNAEEYALTTKHTMKMLAGDRVHPEALPEILKFFKEASYPAKASIISIVSTLSRSPQEHKKITPLLVTAQNDSDPNIRWLMVSAIAYYRSTESQKILQEVAVNDTDVEVRQRAKSALENSEIKRGSNETITGANGE